MTYTFKLARRLAVSRNYAMVLVPALVVLAACAVEDSTAPTDDAGDEWRDRSVAVTVSPNTVTLETNQVARFSGRVHSPSEDSLASTIEWSTSGGSITADGLFSSAQAGTFRVVGRGRKKADTATVVVVPPQPTLASLTIAPATVSLTTGATQQFGATARLSDGTTTTVGLVWVATGGAVDANGLYTAGSTAGTYRVVVANTTGDVADTAAVTLAAPVVADSAPAPAPAPTLTQVVFNPASASLLTGATKQFAVYGRMSNGDSVAVAVTYSATGGTISSGGLYTAGSTAGTYRVIAKASSGPADTAAITLTAPAPAPSTTLAGIPFGTVHLPASNFGAPMSGSVRTLDLYSTKATLDSVRARKGRVALAIARAAMRNSDKTFNIDRWKLEVDRYRTMSLQSYIDDGTVFGLFVVDEPNCGGCWGGKTIPQSTVDELARYAKTIWPNLPTIVRVVPAWFNSYPPQYVDAAWAQWEGRLHVPSGNMTPEQFRDKNVADAKALGLGLVFGINVLDGGDGSSGIAGTFMNSTSSTVNRWQMSAAEVDRVGKVFAATSYACGVISWRWSPNYPADSYLTSTQLAGIRAFDTRSDVQAAVAAVASVAKNRTVTSCRVR